MAGARRIVGAMRHLLAALVLLAACSPTEPPARCTPGAQVACACPGGGSGAQVCAADGASYSACACGVGDAGADAAVDAARADVVDAAGTLVDVPGCEAREGGVWIVCAETTLGPGGCTNLATSTGHCGACGRACASGAACTDGRCSAYVDAAVPQDLRCPSAARPTACVTAGTVGCWDLSTSNNLAPATNCGACGHRCNGACEGGECRP